MANQQSTSESNYTNSQSNSTFDPFDPFYAFKYDPLVDPDDPGFSISSDSDSEDDTAFFNEIHKSQIDPLTNDLQTEFLKQPKSTQLILTHEVSAIYYAYREHGSAARLSAAVMEFLDGGDVVCRPNTRVEETIVAGKKVKKEVQIMERARLKFDELEIEEEGGTRGKKRKVDTDGDVVGDDNGQNKRAQSGMSAGISDSTPWGLPAEELEKRIAAVIGGREGRSQISGTLNNHMNITGINPFGQSRTQDQHRLQSIPNNIQPAWGYPLEEIQRRAAAVARAQTRIDENLGFPNNYTNSTSTSRFNQLRAQNQHRLHSTIQSTPTTTNTANTTNILLPPQYPSEFTPKTYTLTTTPSTHALLFGPDKHNPTIPFRPLAGVFLTLPTSPHPVPNPNHLTPILNSILHLHGLRATRFHDSLIHKYTLPYHNAPDPPAALFRLAITSRLHATLAQTFMPAVEHPLALDPRQRRILRDVYENLKPGGRDVLNGLEVGLVARAAGLGNDHEVVRRFWDHKGGEGGREWTALRVWVAWVEGVRIREAKRCGTY